MSVMLVAFYGCWIDFVPERWVAKASLCVACVVSTGAIAWMLWFNLTGRNRHPHGGKLKALVCAPMFLLLFTAVAWFALAHGVAGALTRLTGNPSTLQAVTMRTDHRHHYRGCDYRLIGDPAEGLLWGHLCIRSAYYRAHPDRLVEVEPTGWRGLLGFYIADFHHLRDLGAGGR